MTKLEKLSLSSLLILGFFIFAVAYHYWQSAYEGRLYPHSSSLFDPDDISLAAHLGRPEASQLSKHHGFGDFFLTWAQNVERDPYGPSVRLPSNYFPFAHLVTLPFSFPSYAASVSSFLVFALLTSVTFSWFNFRDRYAGRWANAKLVMVFALLTQHMLMAIDRGNVELVVFLFMWIGVAHFHRHSYSSAFFLACATAMKGFPGLLLGLFLVKRRYGQLAFALACTVVLNAVSLCLFKGGFWSNLELFGKAAGRYLSMVVGSDPHFVRHTSGWLGMVAWLSHVFPRSFNEVSGWLRWLTHAYPLIRWVLLLYFVAPLLGPRRLALWQLVAPLIFAMIVIMPAAFDYRIILVLIPFGLFVGSRTRGRRLDFSYTLLFSLLFVPKQFVLVGPSIGMGTVINPLIMLSITGMILSEMLVSYKKRA